MKTNYLPTTSAVNGKGKSQQILWGEIAGFENYLVGKNGEILNQKSGRIIKPYKDGVGYMQIRLRGNGVKKRFAIHRLVAKAFIQNPENKPQVNHKNGVKIDNRLENLEWCTQQENIAHAVKNNLIPVGEERYNSRFTEQDILKIRSLSASGITYYRIAKIFGTSKAAIRQIVIKIAWRHVA